MISRCRADRAARLLYPKAAAAYGALRRDKKIHDAAMWRCGDHAGTACAWQVA